MGGGVTQPTKRPLRSLLARLRRRSRRAELMQRLASDHRVLVACHGNICRSPYAAYRLAANLPAGWQVTQGGTAPGSGRSSTAAAIAAAAERGIDLGAHRSRAVTEDDLREAGATLVFDWSIRDDLAARFPHYADRIFLLGEVTPGPVEVRDPFGRPMERYRVTYRDLDRKIEHLIAGLVRRG